MPVQEHHEVRQDRVSVDPAGPDLSHQIHSHGIAAQREEGAMSKGENAAITPNKIDRQRQDGIADVFAKQRHHIGRNLKSRGCRQRQVEDRHNNRDGGERDQDRQRGAVKRADERRSRHASTARPLSANSPRGRFWMNRMMSTRMAILPSTAPANGSRNLLAMPSVKAPTSVPQRFPTPPKTTTMNESMM